MNGDVPARGKIRFADITLDLASAELRSGDVLQRLPEQVFQVLDLLTGRAGELVTREELIARLWPRTTYIDTDAGLNTAVKKLRTLLADDADQPRFIETVPRRGYRFIAAVTAADAMPSPRQRRDTSRRPSRRALWIFSCAASIAMVIALLTWWRSTPRLPRQPLPSVAAPAAPLSRNVAVLPFLNLTGDGRRDYIALGLAENVLHALAQLPQINVIAHTSSFEFRDAAQDVREIGRKLDARYVLEGSLQGSTDQLRVTTQLIDAQTGVHLWSKSFDRPADNLLAVQDEIALAVARALQVSVMARQDEPLLHSGTQNPDAWLAFQRGRTLATTRKHENLVTAIASLRRAVQLDPLFVNAHVELANTLIMQAHYGPLQRPRERQRLARQAAAAAAASARQALAIDELHGDARVVLGAAAGLVGDEEQAEANYRSGLALNPNSVRGLQNLGELLIEYRDQTDAGIEFVRRARALDPLEPRGAYYLGFVELRRGRVEEANKWLLAALEIRPDYAPALVRLATLHAWWHGEFATAIKYAEMAMRSDPQAAWIRVHLLGLYLEIGDSDTARSLISEVGSEPPYGAPLIALFERDYPAAAAPFHADPRRFDSCNNDFDAYAILESARVSKEYIRAIRFLAQRTSINAAASTPIVKPGAEHLATVLAQLLAWHGDNASAQRLLETTLAQLDRAPLPTSGLCVDVGRVRARTLALLGRNNAAIAVLKRLMVRDDRWTGGWYLFERDTAFAALRADPEFQSLARAYREHVDGERRTLTQMRAAGLIPVRPKE